MGTVRRIRYTQQQLFDAWSSEDLTLCEVARTLGVTDETLKGLAREHQLPARPEVPRHTRLVEAGGPPDLWGEVEAGDSLDLCPWVQARIAELRLHERHLEDKSKQDWGTLARLLGERATA